MKKLLSQEYSQILKNSSLLFDEETVKKAFKKMTLGLFYRVYQDPVLVTIMNGGSYVSQRIQYNLNIAHRVTYVHCSRYHGEVKGKENLEWIYFPNDIEGEHVILIDDIFDEGITMNEVVKKFQEKNVKSITTCVLVQKEKERSVNITPDIVGLHAPDKFLIGCGLDYHGYFRQLPEIRYF